jgi:arylsulfatase
MNAPFQWTKQIASHYGGTANGMVISWPTRIKDQGGVRPQWHHVIDIVPTLLDVAGVEQPSSVNGVAQKPIEGVSMSYSFDDQKAPSPRHTQYFEMMGNRGIYHKGWIASTTPVRVPWDAVEPRKDVISGYEWELYHVAEDFSEAVDVADKYPEKLQQLQLLFYAEAAKYNVLPLDHSTLGRVDPAIRPSLTRGSKQFTYAGTLTRIPEGAAPNVKNKSFRITADLDLPRGNENGIVLTQGGLSAGFALFFRDGKPVFDYNFLNIAHYEIAAETAVLPGKHKIVFDFRYDGGGIGKGGTGSITIDGKQVAQGRIEKTVPVRFSLDETLDIGEDTGTPVSENLDVPFKFTGQIEKLVVDLGQQ